MQLNSKKERIRRKIILQRRSFQSLVKVRKTILNSNVIVVKNWDILLEICPLIKEVKERRKNKRHNPHIAKDDEPAFKKEKEEDSSEEYVLVAALTNSINYSDETWLVDSGAFRHMTGFKDSL